VVTAVGHEIDLCLADLAADARAATPSQAAELLVPDDRERLAALEHLFERLSRAMRHRLTIGRERLVRIRARLGEPRRRLLEHGQRIDDLVARLERSMRRRLRLQLDAQQLLLRRLEAQHPRRVLAAARVRILPLVPRIEAAVRRRLADAKSDLGRGAARLHALSPLSVLARGYAIASVDGRVLTDASEVSIGEAIDVRLERGSLSARIEAKSGERGD
jgi:exodeoxyribonuclease VII large subunit